MHLLVDSTGLKLCGSGEWLLEKHGTKMRPSWRKLHIGADASTRQIEAAMLTTRDVDDASKVGTLLDQVDGPVTSFTADGAYEQDGVYGQVVVRHSKGPLSSRRALAPYRATLLQSAPTMRYRHLQIIAERGRMVRQKVTGYNWRAPIEADISRLKRVIGDGLRSRTGQRRRSEVTIPVKALSRMLELGRLEYVRLP